MPERQEHADLAEPLNQQEELLLQLREPNLGTVHPLADESAIVITRQRSPEGEDLPAVGNILRRSAIAAGLGRLATAPNVEGLPDGFLSAEPSERYADINLYAALRALGIEPNEVITVAVNGRGVGFADTLTPEQVKANPLGWLEVEGLDSFFFRPTKDTIRADGASEAQPVGASVARLGDCGFLGVEMRDEHGVVVDGFVHNTKANQHVNGHYAYEDQDGHPVSYVHHALDAAIHHYGSDPTSVHLRLSASIGPELYIYNFQSEDDMDAKFPGWREAGLITESADSDPTSEFRHRVWNINARELIRRDVTEAMQALGIPLENLHWVEEEILDPGAMDGEYSSNSAISRINATRPAGQKLPDTRDAYMVVHQSAVRTEGAAEAKGEHSPEQAEQAADSAEQVIEDMLVLLRDVPLGRDVERSLQRGARYVELHFLTTYNGDSHYPAEVGLRIRPDGSAILSIRRPKGQPDIEIADAAEIRESLASIGLSADVVLPSLLGVVLRRAPNLVGASYLKDRTEQLGAVTEGQMWDGPRKLFGTRNVVYTRRRVANGHFVDERSPRR